MVLRSKEEADEVVNLYGAEHALDHPDLLKAGSFIRSQAQGAAAVAVVAGDDEAIRYVAIKSFWTSYTCPAMLLAVPVGSWSL